MPAYRNLSSSITGAAADSAREAETFRRDGDLESAVVLLEEALEASRALSPRVPGWLCGRLAALYRTVGRYDDEVRLLERYRESQSSDDARTRYDARLSKARTIAERMRRSESGALSSVRKAMGGLRRRPRRAAPAGACAPEPIAEPIAEPHIALLAEVLRTATAEEFEEQLDWALSRYCAEARAREIPPERLVDGLRSASRLASGGAITEALRAERYSVALVRLLALHFGEAER
jgi:hypothetical protein